MREDWKRVRLNEFVWFQRGYDLPKTKFKKGNVPVYGSTSILGYHNIAKVKAPGIITGRSGTLGVMQYAQEDFWPHNTSLWVKDFKGNYERFAYYLLQCLDFGLFNSGGAVPTLNRNTLNAFIIDLPPLPTQRKIASILSAYDDLIENNLKRIQLLEEQAQLTYEEWFVRLKFPGHESTAINKETGLPDGWEKVKLNSISDFQMGYSFRSKVFNEDGNGRKIIRIRNIPSSSSNDFTTQVVDEKYIVKKGDLLVGMDGEFYINNWYDEEAYLVQRTCNVRSHNRSLLGFLTEAIKTPIYIFQHTIDGATVAHLGKKHLDTIEVILPDKIEYFEYFNRRLKQKIYLNKQNQLLKEARNILLPRLMMGLIDVDELDVEGIKKGLATNC